jgi:tetratricopeptide (TPR) repeat protein
MSDRHERELKRVLLSVCDDTGFRLYLATYDQPKRRDELIARVVKEAEAAEVQVTRLELAEAEPDANLVGLLRAHFHETHLPRGWRQAVMVIGLEQRLDYARGRQGYAFLHQANLLRDALPEAAPVPVVLWLSRLASAALPVEAPDLWHWRAANFDFTGDEAPRLELLRELTTLRPEDDLGLSGEQRRARLRMLEDLLAELERERPPRSQRQKAEQADLLLQLGIEFLRLGRAAEAIPHFKRSLELFHEIGDRSGEGNALGNLGIAYRRVGEPRRAIEHFERRLAIAREIGDRRGESNGLGNLGNAYLSLGEPRRAIEYYEHQLAIAREIGDRRGESHALGNLGVVYRRMGEAHRAIGYLDQRLAIAREIGDRSGEGNALGNLGAALFTLGEPQQAIEYHDQHLAVAREVGDRGAEGSALGNLGNAYLALGEPQRAVEYYEKHLAVAREIGDRQGEGDSLLNSALALDQLGAQAKAIKRMEKALKIFEKIESPAQGKARAILAEWQGQGTA